MDTKLHTAVRYGNVNAVLEALKDGFNPNQIGLFKWSPVHEAANNGERDILKLLIAYKGDVNLQDKLHGNSPLHYAAREDNSACVTVLLKAGARIDIKNYEGMTCLDESTPLCREIIQEFVNSRNAGSDWKQEKIDHIHSRNMNINGIPDQNEWGHMPSVPEQAAIGHLHLSFEYHQMKLKIRVWQVSDLLLPPHILSFIAQISMIDSIFVRGYLIPDTSKKTNRQTEAVRVETQSKDTTLPPQNGIQHIFSPSSFRFETPLLYSGVTQAIISERSVRLEVYMTQKHTHKAFLMGMIHMPLRAAVRHPIREKYPLIPCMNYTIPNNMRVYSARDIIFHNASSSLSQLPSRSDSMHSSFSCPVTTRDADMEDFLRRASLELSDSNDDDDVESNDIKSSLGKSRTSAATVDVMSVSTDNEDSIGGFRDVGILHHDIPANAAPVVGSEEKPKVKKKIIPNELLNMSSSSEQDLTRMSASSKDLTVLKKENDSSRTVVKVSALQSDLLLASSGTEKKDRDKIILREPPNGKKKIIPPELLSKTEVSPLESQIAPGNCNSNHGDVSQETYDHICFYDDIHSHEKVGTSEHSHTTAEKTYQLSESRDEKHNHHVGMEDQEDDITSEVGRYANSDTGPSSTPVSRPETPIWDFYDFTLEEGAKSGGNAAETEAGSSKDDASVALGTLQESILRLTSASKKLDTCRVTGPVLPVVMIEDFEMDDVLEAAEEIE